MTCASEESEWRNQLRKWATRKVEASWYPWLLAAINFVDNFFPVGVVVPVMQGVAFAHYKIWRSVMLCCHCAAGGFIGSLCFVVMLRKLSSFTKHMNAGHTAFASDLMRRFGPFAGLVNGILPFTTQPLIILLKAVESSRWRVGQMLILMSLGRCIKFLWMVSVVQAGKQIFANSRQCSIDDRRGNE